MARASSACASAWLILSIWPASASSARCLAASAAASSRSLARAAVSASTVTLLGLHLERAAADVKRLLLAFGRLHPHLARL